MIRRSRAKSFKRLFQRRQGSLSGQCRFVEQGRCCGRLQHLRQMHPGCRCRPKVFRFLLWSGPFEIEGPYRSGCHLALRDREVIAAVNFLCRLSFPFRASPLWSTSPVPCRDFNFPCIGFSGPLSYGQSGLALAVGAGDADVFPPGAQLRKGPHHRRRHKPCSSLSRDDIIAHPFAGRMINCCRG